MRSYKALVRISALVFSLSVSIVSSALAFELPTIVATENVFSGNNCFALRCFPVAFALEGDTAAISTTDPTVTIYARSGGGAWQLQQTLINPDYTGPTTRPAVEMHLPFPPFGRAIAISGDSLLVVGTSQKYNFTDVIYVYHRVNGQWQFIQVLALPRPAGVGPTVATGIATGGEVALVSGIEANANTTQAHVDVFIRREDGTYLRRFLIEPPSEAVLDDGYTMSVSGDGEFALIGDPNAAQGAGRAYLYDRASAGWVLRKTFAPASGLAGARFGAQLVLKTDRLAISAPGQAIAKNLFGAIQIHTLEQGAWHLEQVVLAPEFPPSSDNPAPQPSEGWQFGNRLAFEADRLVASVDNVNWEFPPLGYVFERTQGGWRATATITDEIPTTNTHGLILSGSTLLLASTETPFAPVYLLQLPPIGSPP